MRSGFSPLLATLGAACAAALLAAAPVAFAAQNATAHKGQTSSARQTNEHVEQSRLTEERAKAIESAKVTPAEAIETAQKTHGTAYFVRFELRHGTPAYLIRTYQDDQAWAGLVNADSGQLMGKGRMFKTLDKEDMRTIQAAKSAQTNLLQAVNTAQRERPNAKLLEVALVSATSGRSHYTVDLVENGQVHVAMINPQSGHFE